MGLKKERSAEGVLPPERPKTVEAAKIQKPKTESLTNTAGTRVEMRHVKIADGIEQAHAIEVDDRGNAVRDLGAYHLWEDAQQSLKDAPSSFRGYGVETRSEGSEIAKTPYGSKRVNKRTFSGFKGVETRPDFSCRE